MRRRRLLRMRPACLLELRPWVRCRVRIPLEEVRVRWERGRVWAVLPMPVPSVCRRDARAVPLRGRGERVRGVLPHPLVPLSTLRGRRRWVREVHPIRGLVHLLCLVRRLALERGRRMRNLRTRTLRMRVRVRVRVDGPRVRQRDAVARPRDRRDGNRRRGRNELKPRPRPGPVPAPAPISVDLAWARDRRGDVREGRGRLLRRDDRGAPCEDVELVLVILGLDVPQGTVVDRRPDRVCLRSRERAVGLLSQPKKDGLCRYGVGISAAPVPTGRWRSRTETAGGRGDGQRSSQEEVRGRGNYIPAPSRHACCASTLG